VDVGTDDDDWVSPLILNLGDPLRACLATVMLADIAFCPSCQTPSVVALTLAHTLHHFDTLSTMVICSKGKRKTQHLPADALSASVTVTANKTSTCCCWTIKEEKTLITAMIVYKVEAGNETNFKDTAFHAAARKLAQYPSKGASKMWNNCKDKW
jgi:hypothetical protein